MIAKAHANPTPKIHAKYHITQFSLIQYMLVFLDIFNRYLSTHDSVNPSRVSHDNWHEQNRGEKQQLQGIAAGTGIPDRQAAGRMDAGRKDKWEHGTPCCDNSADDHQAAYDECRANMAFNG